MILISQQVIMMVRMFLKKKENSANVENKGAKSEYLNLICKAKKHFLRGMGMLSSSLMRMFVICMHNISLTKLQKNMARVCCLQPLLESNQKVERFEII